MYIYIIYILYNIYIYFYFFYFFFLLSCYIDVQVMCLKRKNIFFIFLFSKKYFLFCSAAFCFPAILFCAGNSPYDIPSFFLILSFYFILFFYLLLFPLTFIFYCSLEVFCVSRFPSAVTTYMHILYYYTVQQYSSMLHAWLLYYVMLCYICYI